jgi:hypothetical protein
MATMRGKQGTSPDARVDALVAWAEESGRRRAGGPARGGLRFVFYGRVSTEDWQDPVTAVPCPSAADPGRNPHRAGAGWTLGTIATILFNPRYTGRQVWNRQRTDRDLADPADVSLGHMSVQRWNLPDGWVISRKPAHPPWSARETSSPPRTSAPRAAPPPPRA